jgi:hypothetical protein
MQEKEPRVRLRDIVKSGSVEDYTKRMMEFSKGLTKLTSEDYLVRHFIMHVTSPIYYLKDKEDFMLEVMKHAKKTTSEELWKRGVTHIPRKLEAQQRIVEIVHNGVKKEVEVHFNQLNQEMFDSFHVCVDNGKYRVAKFFAAELMNYRDFIGVRRVLNNTRPNEICGTSIINSGVLERSIKVEFHPKRGVLSPSQYKESCDYIFGLSKIYDEFIAKHKEDIAMPYMLSKFLNTISHLKYEPPLFIPVMLLDMVKRSFSHLSSILSKGTYAFDISPLKTADHMFRPEIVKYDFRQIPLMLSYYVKEERPGIIKYFENRIKYDFVNSLDPREEFVCNTILVDHIKKMGGMEKVIKEFLPKLPEHAEKFAFLRANGLFDPALRYKDLSGFAELKNICILSKKPKFKWDALATTFRVMYGILGSCEQLKAALVCFNRHAKVEGFKPQLVAEIKSREPEEIKIREI